MEEVLLRPDLLSPADVAEARQRRLEAMKMQEIEGNPLSPDQVEMFEMSSVSAGRMAAVANIFWLGPRPVNRRPPLGLEVGRLSMAW